MKFVSFDYIPGSNSEHLAYMNPAHITDVYLVMENGKYYFAVNMTDNRTYDPCMPVYTSRMFEDRKDAVAAMAAFVRQVNEAMLEREEKKPLLNCDRYRTADEAYGVFLKFCNSDCDTCPFRSTINNRVCCSFTWLYANAENPREDIREVAKGVTLT